MTLRFRSPKLDISVTEISRFVCGYSFMVGDSLQSARGAEKLPRRSTLDCGRKPSRQRERIESERDGTLID